MAIQDNVDARARRDPGDGLRLIATGLRGQPPVGSLAILTGIAWLLQMLDALTFLQLMALRGPAAELNPLMRSLYLAGGPAAIIAAKAAVAGPIIVLLARMGLRGERRVALVGLLAVSALGVLECLSNLPTPPFS